MMPRLAPIAVAVLTAAATVLAVGTAAGPAAAADTCSGVVVVVDARAAGGSITSRCVSGDPASGLAALEQAGHGSTFVPGIPGFVCTIDQRPDPCNMAPADAHWSYWYAEAGGGWVYSSQGAGFRDPTPGEAEGWRFGDGSQPPGTAPFHAHTPEPAPAPTPEPEPTPAPDPEPTPAPTSGSDPAPSPAPQTSGSSGTTGSSGSDGSSGPTTSSGTATSGADGPPPTGRPAADEREPNVTDRVELLAPEGTDPETADDPDARSRAAEVGVQGSEVDAGADDEGSDRRVAEDPLASADGLVAGNARSGRVPTGPLAGGMLLAGIGGAALWQRNRRAG